MHGIALSRLQLTNTNILDINENLTLLEIVDAQNTPRKYF